MEEGQRPQQYSTHHAENRRIRADPERECRDHSKGEARSLAPAAQRKPEILNGMLHPAIQTGVPVPLLTSRDPEGRDYQTNSTSETPWRGSAKPSLTSPARLSVHCGESSSCSRPAASSAAYCSGV